MHLLSILGVASAEDKERLVEIMLKLRKNTSSREVREAIALYKKYDAITYSQNYAEGLVERAFKTI